MRSYRTVSPLPVPRRAIGGLFSVALSRGSPRVAVSHHRALSCSDFPPDVLQSGDRPTHSDRYYNTKKKEFQLKEKTLIDRIDWFSVDEAFDVVVGDLDEAAW